MEENSNTESREKIKKKKPVFFSVLLCLMLVTSILVDIYFFANDVWNVVGILCASFFTILSTIWLSILFIEKQREKEEILSRWMDETKNAQKALYFLSKKNFSIQEEKLNFLEKKIDEGNENLEKAQKAVGKVLMNHFSEHANAVMNASGHILDLQQEIKRDLAAKENIKKEEIEALFQNQNKSVQEDFDKLTQKVMELSEDKSLEENAKLDLLLEKVEEKYETMYEQMKQLSGTMEEMKNLKEEDNMLVKTVPVKDTDVKLNEEISSKEMEELVPEKEDTFKNIKSETEDAAHPKEQEEVMVLKEIDDDIIYNKIDLDDSSKQVSREELLESDFSNVEEKIKRNKEEFPSSIIEEENEKIKLVPLEKEKKEEKTDSIKRGRKKKTETNEIEKSEEDIQKEVKESEESKTTEEETEKPPMPDLSDANRKMTPEEIAALIANL